MLRFRTRTALLLAGVLGLTALTACSGGSAGKSTSPPPPAVTGLLRQATSAAEFETALKAGLRRAASGDLSTAITTTFSGTYTLEPGIDEFDSVRYDGSYLYVAPQRTMHCCLMVPTPIGGSGPPAERSIRILGTDPASGDVTLVGSIELEDGISVQGLYVSGGRAFVLTSEAFFGGYGDFWSRIAIWAPTQFGVRVYDVSNPASPQLLHAAVIDGVFVDSRRIGDRVYVVSRHTPAALLDASRMAQLAQVPLSELLPRVVSAAGTASLVDPTQCYLTTGEQDAGDPVITSITVYSLSNPSTFVTSCYNDDAYGVYLSETAAYVTQLRPVANSPRNHTRIHRFALGAGAPAYSGSAEIPGAVWSGGQADFRMSEHQGYLRAVTTDFVNDPGDSTDHRLYVLRQNGTEPKLDVVAQLPNASRPQKIGRDNESLFGVRFHGARAYLVTFLRLDPLHVVDLANPLDPRIAGELEVPGFSDLLHPVTNDLLLGIGQSEIGGVQIALYDVSRLDQPLERGRVTIGAQGTWSDARYDRHAFSYLPAGNGVDRFALPADVYNPNSLAHQETGLYLFEIHDKATAPLASLHAVGSILLTDPQTGDPLPQAGRNRSYINGNTVFYVRDDQVWSAPWTAPVSHQGPY